MAKDLTVGNTRKVLWKFSLALFISVIFQQFYNLADTIIAGKFAGENALSAVGVSYPITMIFMAIALGSNIGCSVVISKLFGAKQFENVKTAIYTTLLCSLVLSVVLTAIGIGGTTLFLNLINTPADIFADTATYYKIYMLGFCFLFMYNITTGIFTALGDAITPLIFLIASSLLNIVLDYVFVAKFSWGVAGVAWATFIAQGLACILLLISLIFKIKTIKTSTHIIKFSVVMLKKIMLMSLPSILQQSFVSIGNIFVQSIINGFGSSVIAGFTAGVKLNTFVVTCLMTLANGVSSFTAQNIGAKQVDRVKEGFRAGIELGIALCIPFIIAYSFFGDNLVRLFMKEESVVAVNAGSQYLKIVSPFYIVALFKIVADGVLRGAGTMRYFMISTFADLILRVLLSFILAHFLQELGVWISWPIGWSVGMIVALTFYFKGVWKKGVNKI
ncbi:MAG: MATE family efflux transporter [Clostridia bacterium]